MVVLGGMAVSYERGIHVKLWCAGRPGEGGALQPVPRPVDAFRRWVERAGQPSCCYFWCGVLALDRAISGRREIERREGGEGEREDTDNRLRALIPTRGGDQMSCSNCRLRTRLKQFQRLTVLQGYLAHKKQAPPRTLQ